MEANIAKDASIDKSVVIDKTIVEEDSTSPTKSLDDSRGPSSSNSSTTGSSNGVVGTYIKKTAGSGGGGSRARTFPYTTVYRARLKDLKFPNSVDIFLPIPTDDNGELDSDSGTPTVTPFHSSSGGNGVGGSAGAAVKFVRRSQSYANLNPRYLLQNLLKDRAELP